MRGLKYEVMLATPDPLTGILRYKMFAEGVQITSIALARADLKNFVYNERRYVSNSGAENVWKSVEEILPNLVKSGDIQEFCV